MSKYREGNPCALYRLEGGRVFLRDTRTWDRLADLHGDGEPSPRPLI
jgi:hypothetical protein